MLGPVLFLIFINDLPECIILSNAKLFADDTKLYKEINNVTDCDDLQSDINNAQDWSEKWNIHFHPDKCKVLRIGKAPLNYTYTLAGHQLECVTAEKDLGITIDNRLNFNTHVATVVSKSNRILGTIRRTFRYLDKPSFLHLYKGLVRTMLEYRVPAWAPFSQQDIDKLESVQRRATKLVPYLRRVSYCERLKRLDLFSLAHRRMRGDMIHVYKLINNLITVNKPLFTLADPTTSRTRGHIHKLVKIRANTSLRQNCFSYRAINKWNNLPADVVEAPSLNAFKSRFDRFMYISGITLVYTTT